MDIDADGRPIQAGSSSEKLLPSAPSAANSPYPPDIDLDKPSIAEVRQARQLKARQAGQFALGQQPGGGGPGGPDGMGGPGGGPGGGGEPDGGQQSYEIQVRRSYTKS